MFDPTLAYIDLGATVPYILALCLVFGSIAVLLMAFDVLADDSTKAWRRLAEMRGYARPRGRLEKLATRATFIRRIQETFDLTRLLGIMGRSDTALGFLGKAVAVGLAASAFALGLDGVYDYEQGHWLFGSPVLCLFVMPIGSLMFIQKLRQDVGDRQAHAGQSLGDSLMLVAIMTDGRGLQLEDAVRILSRCVESEDLEYIVDKKGFQKVIHQPYRSTIELYRMIGEEYRIPAFLQLSDAAANANVGFSERDTYTRLAKAIYQQRLSDAKMKAARAKIMVTIPVAGMLMPLLLLLGAPIFTSIAKGLAG